MNEKLHVEKTGTYRKIGGLNYNGNYANPWTGRHLEHLRVFLRSRKRLRSKQEN